MSGRSRGNEEITHASNFWFWEAAVAAPLTGHDAGGDIFAADGLGYLDP